MSIGQSVAEGLEVNIPLKKIRNNLTSPTSLIYLRQVTKYEFLLDPECNYVFVKTSKGFIMQKTESSYETLHPQLKKKVVFYFEAVESYRHYMYLTNTFYKDVISFFNMDGFSYLHINLTASSVRFKLVPKGSLSSRKAEKPIDLEPQEPAYKVVDTFPKHVLKIYCYTGYIYFPAVLCKQLKSFNYYLLTYVGDTPCLVFYKYPTKGSKSFSLEKIYHVKHHDKSALMDIKAVEVATNKNPHSRINRYKIFDYETIPQQESFIVKLKPVSL